MFYIVTNIKVEELDQMRISSWAPWLVGADFQNVDIFIHKPAEVKLGF